MTPKPKPDPKEVRKGCTILVVLILVPVLCFYLFCGEERQPSAPQAAFTAEDTMRAVTMLIHTTVEEYLAQNLHDAGSYESVLWGEPIAFGGGYMVRHKYRARNVSSAFVLSDQFFTIGASGQVESVQPFD